MIMDYIRFIQNLDPGSRGGHAPQYYGAGEFMCGAFFYASMYWVGHVLYRRAEPRLVQLHGPKKAHAKQFDFISRVPSTIHSSWAFYMTYREWQETNVLDQWTQTFSPTYQRILAFSCAYFLADFIACVLVASERGIERVGIATLFHHVTTTLAQTGVLVYSGPKLLTAGLMTTEGTTPIVNLRWYILNFGYTGWPLKVMNVVMTLAFLFIRIPVCTVCTSAIFAHLGAVLPPSLEWQLSLVIVTTVTGITFLNYYWLYLMVSGVFKGGKAAQKQA